MLFWADQAMRVIRSQRTVSVWIVREGFLEEEYFIWALNDE